MASTTQTYVISNRTRTEFRGGTEKILISEENLNPWFFCKICLHPAREPYCCKNGCVYCKECIIEYILSKTNELEKEKNGQVNQTNKKHKKESVKCPSCQTKIKFSKLSKLSFNISGNSPICPSCKREIIGSLHARRLSCTHVVCDSCYSTIVEKTKQCPQCLSNVNTDETILMNKSILSQRKSGGQIIITRKDLVGTFG